MCKKDLILCAMFLTAFVALSACQSDSSSLSESIDEQTTMQGTVDYTGLWMTSCIALNAQQSSTTRLELNNDGSYKSERKSYNDQDCSSEEDLFSLTDVGTYVVQDTVDLPSGVVANSVILEVESRVRNGEEESVRDDQGYLDFFHRDGNTLIRARVNPVGVAGAQLSEELDFSLVYFLEENV